jgi:hypothetical protein
VKRASVTAGRFCAAAAVGAAVLIAASCSKTPGAAAVGADTSVSTSPVAAHASDSGAATVSDSVVAPPPFTPGIFPCSRCHAKLITNPTRRKLTWAHTEIELHHDEENRWCLDCHDADNRDVLHLASGRPVPFTESYRLCGQCHGTKLRDWRAGAHGRRTGSWSGQKNYLLCANCHNPHSPHFKPLVPMPPPVRPADLRTGGANSGASSPAHDAAPAGGH